MHVPVMKDEVVKFLVAREGGTYVDGTLGGGGHALAVLRAAGRSARLIGCDCDETAVERSRGVLKEFEGQCRLAAANFRDLERVVGEGVARTVDGVLLDLGISSWQLDTAERGFGFQREGPLDMRMDQRMPVTAEALVNSASEERLAVIFREFGEEKFARSIAARIVRARRVGKIRTTVELADLIAEAAPFRGRIHPATRCFQALRMAVNDETENLRAGLAAALNVLAFGGRMAVISFHSIEDRIVKKFFREHAGKWDSLAGGGRVFTAEEPVVRLITRKVVKPSCEEIGDNPRARSAKLRVVEKIRHSK